MIEVFSKNRVGLAELSNAFNVKEEKRINSVYYFSFSMPASDNKNEYCQLRNLIRYDNTDFYRITEIIETTDENGDIHYKCEHVIATLIDEVMFGNFIIGNRGIYTKDVINFILGRQKTKNWVLGECDFSRQFEYKLTDENLLGALFSVPRPFTDKYIWTYNTSVYPYVLNLKLLDESKNPEFYITIGKNFVKKIGSKNTSNLVTRIYPKGFGEEINQLTIEKVNNGIPYIQSSKEIIDKYGLIETVWSDRRYENAESLLASAKAMLKELEQPLEAYEIDFAKVGNSYFDIAEIGKIVLIDDGKETIKTYVTEIRTDYEEIEQSKITIANKTTSIASSIADLADRQRIEMTYSQGATQIYAVSKSENADKNYGAVLDFPVPAEMIYVNSIDVKIRLGKFRAYSKATDGGGAIATSTESGGSITTTSLGGGGVLTSSSSSGGVSKSTDSGGGGVDSTDSGGGGYKTSASGGGDTSQTSSRTTSEAVTLEPRNIQAVDAEMEAKHNHGIGRSPDFTQELITSVNFDKQTYTSTVFIASGAHIHKEHRHNIEHTHRLYPHTHGVELPSHRHTVYFPTHSHNFNIPAHTHSVSLQNHTHSISLPNHTHNFKMPNHVHNIEPGIYFLGGASAFDLWVNGSKKASFSGTGAELEISNYLLNSKNTIDRGNWQTIEIRPNGLSYITISLSIQGFIQSRGDRTL